MILSVPCLSSSLAYGSPSRRYLAVGCGTGIYVGPATSESRFISPHPRGLPHRLPEFQRILNYRNATALAALTTWGGKEYNRLVIHAESSLVSCSLGTLVRRLAGSEVDKRTPDSETSVERVIGSDTNVTFFKHVHVGGRSMREWMLCFLGESRTDCAHSGSLLEAKDGNFFELTGFRSCEFIRVITCFEEIGHSYDAGF